MGFLDLFFFLAAIALSVFLSALVLPIPISDLGQTRYRTIPYMTLVLILVNATVFLFFQAFELFAVNRFQNQMLSIYLSSGDIEREFATAVNSIYLYVEKLWLFGFRAHTLREGASIGTLITFTSMFMHADVDHLLYNMIFLWTFGRRLEDAAGPWRFLLFYLSAGMVANIASGLLGLRATFELPGIGASGAIFGLVGAYLVLFTTKEIMCVWGIGIPLRLIFNAVRGKQPREEYPWWSVPLPALLPLISYLILNVLGSLEQVQSDGGGGVNYIAHMGGLLTGVVIFLFIRKDMLQRYLAGRAV